MYRVSDGLVGSDQDYASAIITDGELTIHPSRVTNRTSRDNAPNSSRATRMSGVIPLTLINYAYSIPLYI